MVVEKKKRIIIGATGASGLPLTIACLKIIGDDPQFESHLIMSENSIVTLGQEMSLTTEECYSLADYIYDNREIGAGPASGTFENCGMLVVPCSMKTLAGIYSGYSDNLLLRSADVALKEKRKLVLGVRETPLSTIHLRNMYELSLLSNVEIMPLMVAYYQRPESLRDMEYHMACKLVTPFGIQCSDYKRWEGL